MIRRLLSDILPDGNIMATGLSDRREPSMAQGRGFAGRVDVTD
jgi:hypothetical protein